MFKVWTVVSVIFLALGRWWLSTRTAEYLDAPNTTMNQNSTPFVLGTSPSRPTTGVHAIRNATASALNALSAL